MALSDRLTFNLLINRTRTVFVPGGNDGYYKSQDCDAEQVCSEQSRVPGQRESGYNRS